MDLTVDNRLINKTTTNPEMDLFIKELSETLNRRQNDIFSKTICNEIYNDIPLANRYKNQIENLVDNYMIEMSYERDFLYYDYDTKKDSYYFDFYSNGEKQQIEIPEDEVKIMGSKTGTFWEIYNEEKIVGADYIKDSIKINVESELQSLESNSKRWILIKEVENDNTTTDYVINRKNNEFHLYKSKCSKIQNVESKYLLETTTTKKDLEKADLVPCNKCII